jgi:phenylacetic acid degradation operon negative regulatory protein
MLYIYTMPPPAPQHAPTPKRLILSLLSAPGYESVAIATLIAWGQLFDIEPAATRVAVGRMVKQGLLASRSRGLYNIGPRGQLMATTAARWMHAEQRVDRWRGDWLLVHAAHLGRSDKPALRLRERAFRLNGFAEWVGGLWCRPANLRESAGQIRERLLSLGMEREAVLVRTAETPGLSAKALSGLWPREALEAGYRGAIGAMNQSLARLATLDTRQAARETFIIGEAVIRRINSDPLLPEAMVDTAARRSMVDHMLKYNAAGQAAWRALDREARD